MNEHPDKRCTGLKEYTSTENCKDCQTHARIQDTCRSGDYYSLPNTSPKKQCKSQYNKHVDQLYLNKLFYEMQCILKFLFTADE